MAPVGGGGRALVGGAGGEAGAERADGAVEDAGTAETPLPCDVVLHTKTHSHRKPPASHSQS